MPATADGRGPFGNPSGGGRRWVEFPIVLESADVFHGEVINAGSNYHRIHAAEALRCSHGAESPCFGPILRQRLDIARRLQDP